MKIIVQKDKTKCKINGKLFFIEQWLKLKDIAFEINEEKIYNEYTKDEIQQLISPSNLDFENIHYCFKSTEVSENYVLVDNCNKLFSNSFFKISRIFLSDNQLYLLLNDNVIIKVVEDKIEFTQCVSDIRFYIEDQKNKHCELLHDIINIYQREIKGEFTKEERIEMVKDILFFNRRHLALKKEFTRLKKSMQQTSKKKSMSVKK